MAAISPRLSASRIIHVWRSTASSIPAGSHRALPSQPLLVPPHSKRLSLSWSAWSRTQSWYDFSSGYALHNAVLEGLTLCICIMANAQPPGACQPELRFRSRTSRGHWPSEYLLRKKTSTQDRDRSKHSVRSGLQAAAMPHAEKKLSQIQTPLYMPPGLMTVASPQ